jgi:thiol-disulfide isomerase/thioredoxin
MRAFCACALVVVVLGQAPAANGPGNTSPADAYKALSAEYDRAYKEARTKYKAVKDDGRIDEEARNYRAFVHKLELEYAPRFLALAEKSPGDPIAVDALVRAAQLGGGDTPDSEKALDLLQQNHLNSPKISDAITDVTFSTKWAGADKFLRAVIEKSSSREARGLASYWLAYRLRDKAADELSGVEADKAASEAESLLQMVAAKYADVSSDKRGPLGARAAIALAELRRLAVGHVAPEIEGVDGDGKHFRLSEYRGKVVVLDFWGHWCPDCRGVYPRQKELAKRFEGKPFALVGINSDENKDELKKNLQKRGVTWRYWWDGGSRTGPIATAWNIQNWPTIYVLDQKGVIRYRGHEELAEKLEQLVGGLLKEGSSSASAR